MDVLQLLRSEQDRIQKELNGLNGAINVLGGRTGGVTGLDARISVRPRGISPCRQSCSAVAPSLRPKHGSAQDDTAAGASVLFLRTHVSSA